MEKHTAFIADLSDNQFANRFHGEWCSPVCNHCLSIYTFVVYLLLFTIVIGKNEEPSRVSDGQCSLGDLACIWFRKIAAFTKQCVIVRYHCVETSSKDHCLF